MGLLPEVVSVLKGDITDFSNKMGEAHKKMGDLEAKGASSSSKFASNVKAGMLAGGAAMAGAGAALTAIAEPMERAQKNLEVIVKNTGQSYEELAPDIEKAIATQERFGHGTADTEEALAKLTAANHNARQSLADMSLVADLAAFKHISLADAAEKVVKMHAGSAKAFAEFGINIKDGAKLIQDAAAAASADEAAQKNLAAAQLSLVELQDRLNDKQKLSVGQVIELRKAHEALAVAMKSGDHKAIATATQNLTDIQAKNSAGAKLSVSDQQALAHAHTAVKDATEAATKAHANSTAAAAASKGAIAGQSAALEQLKGTIKGSADAQANTFSGMVDRIKATATDLAGRLGQVVGPALMVTGPALAAIAQGLDTGIVKGVGRAIAALLGLGAAESVVAVTSEGLAIAEMSVSWPILAIVAAIALLVGGFIWAYANIKPFHAAVDALANVIRTGLGAAIQWLGEAWNAVWPVIQTAVSVAWAILKPILTVYFTVALVAIKAAIWALAEVWKSIWPGIHLAVTLAWNILKPIFGFIGDRIREIPLVLKVTQLAWDQMWNGIHSTVKSIWDKLRPIFDAIGKGVSAITGAVNTAAGIAAKWNPLGPAPRAAGGPVTAGEAYIVGETQPELFIPSTSGRIVPNLGGGGTVIHVHVAGNILSPDGLAATVRSALIRQGRSLPSLGLA